VDGRGEEVAGGGERETSSDGFQRTAIDITRSTTNEGAFVGEAASLAATQNLDIFDLVAEDGKIVSSAEWPARFGYTLAWATSRAPATPFLQVVELPHETTLALVTVRRVNAGSRAPLVDRGRRLDHAPLAGLV